jgi:hypothetical protein
LSERGDERIGHAVSEKLVSRLPGQVLERQDGERSDAPARGRAPGGSAGGCAPRRVERTGRLECLERGVELPGIAIAIGRIAGQTSQHDPAETWRHWLGQRGRDAPEDRRAQREWRIALIRAMAGRQLVQHDSKRPDVGSRCRRFSAQLLRRHVRQGAFHRAATGQERLRLCGAIGELCCYLFCQAEVQDLDTALR